MNRLIPAILGMAIAGLGQAAEPAQEANGWRGNGTGIWPDAAPPLEWSRTPKGVIASLRATAQRPTDGSRGIALAKGIVPEWLVVGSFPNRDASKQVDELRIEPNVGEKAGELAWKSFSPPLDDRWAFGPATPPFANLATAIGACKPNESAYLHTYLNAATGGEVEAVVDHTHGMTAWLNGKEIYRSADRHVSLGSYYPFSRVEFGTDEVVPSPHFRLSLKPGWNRLLVNLTSFTREDEGWNRQTFLLRLLDVPSVGYESKNIRWMTDLPQRSNASPIIAGDRIFVMSEPDELICIDKASGGILWKASNSYYETLSPDDRAANPAFAAKVQPLLEGIRTERNFVKRLSLRTRLQRTLVEIDRDRFEWKADGHFEAHFGIVGFTSPSPVTDGKHVWAWCGNGVAACYDLNGKREWIRRIPSSNLTYSSSPALADGVFAVYLGKLFGLDAATGAIRWEQKRINHNSGAILAARIAGVPVFISSIGHVIRATDGKILYEERNREGGTSSWAPGVVLGDTVCLPRYGARHLLVLDFAGVKGEEWQPKRTELGVPDGVPREPNGRRRDRSTPASPLVVGGTASTVDIYSTFYSFDLKERKFQYYRDTELNGWFHYNAVPVAASPTLIANHIVIQDNQGLALVLKQGAAFDQVRKNHIETVLERWWPVPAQETIGYSAPIADGNRLYIRGERYLYCIGAP